MKSAVLLKKKNWLVKSTNIPEKIKNNKAIVKITMCGICSTDVLRSMKTGFYKYPIIPGHEIIGKIHKVSKNHKIKIGDRVAVYPLIPCKKCTHCKNKNFNLCEKYDFLGSRSNGGYANYVEAPIENLIKIPKNVSDSNAVFTEPLSVALHAFKIAENNFKPKKIAILGLGPIGLMIALWAKQKGIKNVIGIDRNLNRFNAFKRIGFKKIINTKQQSNIGKNQVDTIFECSGSTKLQEFGLNLLDKKGQFILLSNPNENFNFNKKLYSSVLRNEKIIQGSWSSKIQFSNEWNESLNFLKHKKLNPSICISHLIKLDDLPKTIKSMYYKKFPFIKIVVKN